MLTPQEIAETPLSKVRFGGYDMGEVDDFLEAITEDYSALYKENAILKGKLKVLVEKIEEYRKTEDAMRIALMTAQKTSEDIKTEAEKQRESVLRDANEEIKVKLAETAKRVADEELRLSVAAKETSKFIELSQAIMKRHSEFLAKLEAATRVLHQNRQDEGRPVAPATPAAPIIPTTAPSPVTVDKSPTTNLTPLTASAVIQDQHIVDVADHIDSAMQRITGTAPAAAPAAQAPNAPAPATPVPQRPAAPAPAAQIPVAPAAPIPPITQPDAPPMFAQQTIQDFDLSNAPTQTFPPIVNFDETTPRPKFDFDDLRFGDNF